MIEVRTFRLVDGVAAEAFRSADERLQTEFYYLQPGLIRRTSGRSHDGVFVALTHWDSDEQADAAAASLESAPAWTAIARLIALSSQAIQRFSTL